LLNCSRVLFWSLHLDRMPHPPLYTYAAAPSFDSYSPMLPVPPPKRTPREEKLQKVAAGLCQLERISEKLQQRIGKISLAGRCHKWPRTLESDYSLSTKVLGTGYNGKVHLARSRINRQQMVAVKQLSLVGLTAAKKDHLMSETSIFLSMDHPHVARLLDVYESSDSISLVMEHMEGGELFNRLLEAKQFSEDVAADATRQMLLAVNYLHSNGIVHRDLKLENFLYESTGSRHLKMIDFGFSKFCGADTRLRTTCGTLAYVAPEVLNGAYTSQCDLWSMGVLVFALLSGRMPFHAEISSIKKGEYDCSNEYWWNVSSVAVDFVKALLVVDPAKRLTAREALEHRWLKHSFHESCPPCDTSVLASLRSWVVTPKLRRACMSVMAWSATNRHHAQVREHFLALDRNHDGKVSLHELKEAFAKDGCGSDEEINRTFDMLAQDHLDIHYSDFLAAMLGSHVEVEDDLLHATFRKFDKNGLGSLHGDSSPGLDAEDLMNILGANFDGADMDMLVYQGDLNGDGKLDFDEFAQYVRSRDVDAWPRPVVLGKPLSSHNASQNDFNDIKGTWQQPVAMEVTNRQPKACCAIM